jgi:hypothetical protein
MNAAFLSTAQIERVLTRYPTHLVEIALTLREMVIEIAPDAAERVLRRGLGYHRPERGGPVRAGVCQIEIRPDHVRLAFIHGAFLPDPESLLEGEPRYKKYVRIECYEDAPWDVLEALIRASATYDPGA